MSRFFSERFAELTPYVPGEQPKDQQYVKLNTNESPFPPCPEVIEAAQMAAQTLQLYPDPDAKELVRAIAKHLGVPESRVLLTNGSDATLNYAFMAFCDDTHPIVFPDITYGFYPVIAALNRIPYRTVPLTDDFSIDPEDYCKAAENVVLANPNAPTGKAMPLKDIERIVASGPDRVVIVDEAYVDFGGESAIPLVENYSNLLVVQTFSKSRSLAGGRLGIAVGQEPLIADLNTLKYSSDPYTVNRMTLAAGVAAVENDAWFRKNCEAIRENREYLTRELQTLGFFVVPSAANFVFARTDAISGEALYLELKRRGVLVRHFTAERIKDYNRITVGSRKQLETLLREIRSILEER